MRHGAIGIVMDAEYNRPVAGAKITAGYSRGTPESVLSASDGSFNVLARKT
jgi:hypothetical protein